MREARSRATPDPLTGRGHGFTWRKLRVVPTDRGNIYRMLQETDPEIAEMGIGEVYFSVCEPDAVKAWHLHTRMTLNYVCILGRAKVVTFAPGRDSAPVEHILEGYGADPAEYKLLTIEPGIWNGFRALPIYDAHGNTALGPIIICNASSLPHDPHEIIRLPVEAFDAAYGEYDWGAYRLAG